MMHAMTEVTVLLRLAHPNIVGCVLTCAAAANCGAQVRSYESFVDGDLLIIVMEFVDGGNQGFGCAAVALHKWAAGDLESSIAKHRDSGGFVPSDVNMPLQRSFRCLSCG